MKYFTHQPYSLPDNDLLQSEQNQGYMLFIPEQKYLILGRSNQAEEAVFVEKALADGVQIMQRASGGQTVLLSENTLVIAIKMPLVNGFRSDKYFELANGVIIKCLEKMGVKNLHSKGISDLSIGELKILGSAIYRSQTSVFYHAVLNLSESNSSISKYIKHPSKEPDYRQGRSHDEFVTSLQQQGFDIPVTNIIACLTQQLKSDYFIDFS
jgi:lipoate-protein ligase A